MRDHAADPATEAFVAHRNLLFTVAYEILGSAADAEDVVQEAWLRWAEVDLAQVRDRRAFLVRVTTRRALDRLRALRRRRETSVGRLLPEPLLASPDAAEDSELAESLSRAVGVVLATLSPVERAVFVLREVFDVGYGEIAAAVGKTPAAVRQIAHRARKHLGARRPRHAVRPHQVRAALASLRHAAETGDLQRVLDVLAPDVAVISEGGGAGSTAIRPDARPAAGPEARPVAGPAAGLATRPARVIRRLLAGLPGGARTPRASAAAFASAAVRRRPFPYVLRTRGQGPREAAVA